MNSETPHISFYRKHIIMCTGDKCSTPDLNVPLYEELKEKLKAQGLTQGPNRIHRSKSSCLGVCEGGPVAVIYPEGVWYHHLDSSKLERVIKEHFIEDQPVSEFVFHHLD